MRTKGFTLIEVLVVIAIIALLATLVITYVSNARQRAYNSEAKSDVSVMAKTIETFRLDQRSNAKVIDSGRDTSTSAQTGYPAGVYVGAFSTLTVTASGAAVTNENTTTGRFTDIFGGTENSFTTNAVQYGITITNTPSSTYTYRYRTESVGGVTANRLFTTNTARTANSTCYIITTNLNTSISGTANAHFSVINGNSDTAAAAPTQCNP